MKNIKKGFTLVELLFVMAIIAILAGFAIANLKDSTKVANENSLKNDVKNIIAQQQTYFAANQSYFNCLSSADEVTGAVGCSGTGWNGTHEGVFLSKPFNNKWIRTDQQDCGDGTIGFYIRVNDETSGKSVKYNSCEDGTIQLLNETGC